MWILYQYLKPAVHYCITFKTCLTYLVVVCLYVNTLSIIKHFRSHSKLTAFSLHSLECELVCSTPISPARSPNYIINWIGLPTRYHVYFKWKNRQTALWYCYFVHHLRHTDCSYLQYIGWYDLFFTGSIFYFINTYVLFHIKWNIQL